MITSRTATIVGLAASILAIVITVMNVEGVRMALAHAYTYPNSEGLGLDEATSMTLTYLFVISGSALIVALLYLLVRPLQASRGGWWAGGILTVLGIILAVYNATQEFPIAIKVVYFLPAIAGILWLALPGSGRREAV